MKRIKVAASILSLMLSPLLAVSYSPVLQPVARKIDEYNIKDLKSHDEQMRLWTAFDDFVKEPENARLFIIGYSNLPGGARRYAARAKNYLVEAHGVKSDRIQAVDGGYRTEASVEIWIVPAKSQEPSPKPTGTFQDNGNAAWKYDEFPLVGWWLVYAKCCERDAERLDGFASSLRSNQQTKGYIVVYKGALDCEYCLRPGTEFRFAKYEKDYLIKEHKIAPSRIVITSGGNVEGGKIEFWIVPRGARIPIKKSGLRPKRNA